MGQELETISLGKSKYIDSSTYIYLLESISNFDKSLLVIDSKYDEDKYIMLFAFSIDGTNYSDYKDIENFQIPDNSVDVYISLYVKQIMANGINPTSIYRNKNSDQRHRTFTLNGIKYNNVNIDLENENKVKYSSEYYYNDPFPKWNFYDNQEINVREWLQRCDSNAEMAGMKCIYFKTNAIDYSHTLRSELNRKVVSVKIVPINLPAGELPNLEEMVFDDFDSPFIDDFTVRLVCNKFRLAFGEKEIPNQKDYLYMPFLNKLFTIAIVKPIPKFMGKVGWWELSLVKYQSDDSVQIDENLNTELNNIPLFEEAMDQINVGEVLTTFGNDFVEKYDGNVLEQLAQYKEDTVLTSEKLKEKNIEEKKTSTENLHNYLVDSNYFISAKETDSVREYYNNRLGIITVNPDTFAFPVHMFDCRTVKVREVAMQYKLSNYNAVNKFSLLCDKNLDLTFDYVLLSRYTSDILNILDKNGDNVLIRTSVNRNKIQITSEINSTESKTFDNELELNELYRISLSLNIAIKQLSIRIYTLIDTKQELIFNDIFVLNNELQSFEIGYVHLYGGKCLCSAIELKNNDKLIMKDYCHPLLQINQL